MSENTTGDKKNTTSGKKIKTSDDCKQDKWCFRTEQVKIRISFQKKQKNSPVLYSNSIALVVF